MTESDIIRRDHPAGVVELCLNRNPVNALSAPFLMDLAAQIDGLARDDAAKAILLTSDFKVFSAGLDLKEAQHFDLSAQHDIVKGLNVGFLSLYACPKPVIVAVNGAAIAGGLFFVLCSDLRLANPEARFGLAEVRVGADFPVGPLELARATLTADAARNLMLTGHPITTDRAYALGIVDEIVDTDRLRDVALKRATDLASAPATTFASVKRQLRGDVIASIKAAMEAGGNAPEGGWFNAETVPAMQRMIGE